MASLNQLISEIAHAVGQPNNVPLRRNIRLAIIHTRNELIRQSYANHRYVDKGLMQRIRLSLIDVKDGDLFNGKYDNKAWIVKRTTQYVHRPVRLTNNLPFSSVRTVGFGNRAIPFNKEMVGQFYEFLPGICKTASYDYINEYIYLFANKDSNWGFIESIKSIIVEAAFEHPDIINIETNEGIKERENNHIDTYNEFDDDEFLLPEDMIGPIKDIIFKRNLLDMVRTDNEIPLVDKVNR